MTDTPTPQHPDFGDPLAVLHACHEDMLAQCEALENLVGAGVLAFDVASPAEMAAVLAFSAITNNDKICFLAEYPFPRGVQPTMYRGRFWTMRQYAGFGTAAESNARECLVSQRTDHRGVDEVQHVLREHATDDGKSEAEDTLAARRRHTQAVVTERRRFSHVATLRPGPGGAS